MTPSEAILEFLAARPNTIRDNLYWQVGMGVDDNCIPGGIESDIVSFVTKFLTGGTKLRNFKNAILVGAVLDHVFSRPHSREWAKEFERIRAACSLALRAFAVRPSRRFGSPGSKPEAPPPRQSRSIAQRLTRCGA